MKYAIYIGVILLVALFVEQIVTIIYNVTLQGAAGDFQAYLLLIVFWMSLYMIGRLFLDKRYNPKSSQYILWGSMTHIGSALAIYFYNTTPLLLCIFPAFFGVYIWSKWKGGAPNRFQFKTVHPEFVDDRGGVCVLRSGMDGFTLVKFFTIKPPLPLMEILFFLHDERAEFTFEIQHSNDQSRYCIGLIERGKDYEYLHRLCMTHANNFRQHLRRQRVEFTDVDDYLNAQLSFYAPYFFETPSPLDPSGIPLRFPELTCEEGDVIIKEEDAERAFTLHMIFPHFEKNKLYDFLKTLNEEYYLQFHIRPLWEGEIEQREEKARNYYRDSVNKLSTGTENDDVFQAATLLFNQMGTTTQKSFEPLLDQDELRRLNEVKEELRKYEVGRQIGLWEVEVFLLGNAVLARTIAIKVNGSYSPLSSSYITPLVERKFIRYSQESQILDSKSLHAILPQSRPIQISQGNQ